MSRDSDVTLPLFIEAAFAARESGQDEIARDKVAELTLTFGLEPKESAVLAYLALKRADYELFALDCDVTEFRGDI